MKPSLLTPYNASRPSFCAVNPIAGPFDGRAAPVYSRRSGEPVPSVDASNAPSVAVSRSWFSIADTLACANCGALISSATAPVTNGDANDEPDTVAKPWPAGASVSMPCPGAQRSTQGPKLDPWPALASAQRLSSRVVAPTVIASKVAATELAVQASVFSLPADATTGILASTAFFTASLTAGV